MVWDARAKLSDDATPHEKLKSLTEAELYFDYRDLAEAHRSIGRFLEKVYTNNEERLHSALGNRPPARV